jgi:hypothetical protein
MAGDCADPEPDIMCDWFDSLDDVVIGEVLSVADIRTPMLAPPSIGPGFSTDLHEVDECFPPSISPGVRIRLAVRIVEGKPKR